LSLNSEENRNYILALFNGLAADEEWEVKSPIDPRYNCIAWARHKDYTKVWPHKDVDGIEWPDDLPFDTEVVTFVALFAKAGYTVCEDSDFVEGVQKIALYVDEQDKITHASRQLLNAMWTSKLGDMFDIEHSDPFVIESPSYGTVSTILCRVREGT